MRHIRKYGKVDDFLIKIGDYVKITDYAYPDLGSKYKEQSLKKTYLVTDISVGLFCLYNIDEGLNKGEFEGWFKRVEIRKLTDEEELLIISKKFNL